VVILLALLGPARPAEAAGDKRVCIAASESAQRLRKEGKLRAAREQLAVCSARECPALIRQDCAGWLNDVVSSTPSVVVAAKDTQGRDTMAVKLFIDGELVQERLDGKAIALDPGMHTFRYELDAEHAHEDPVAIREGEKNRVLAVSFQSNAAAPVTPAAARPAEPAPTAHEEPSPTHEGTTAATKGPAPIPLGAYVFGGAALASLGIGSVLLLSAGGDARSLRSSCAPSCDQGQVDSARSKALVGDVALGVGVVAAAAAVWMVLVKPPAPAPKRDAVWLPRVTAR